MATADSVLQGQRRRRATVGAFVGTAIEWYDFFIFGTAAALVFGKVFYPDVSPAAGVLASFATFWVGFLARPLGGIVFGHLGDRLGRKNVLVATLFLMGGATTLIGVLPTYAQIGVAAPVLLVLLRAAQGLAVGGEWAGATLMATESAEGSKKTMAGTWVQQGSPAGSILATLMFMMVGSLPDGAFLAWGWRIPFLFSAVLVIVGLIIRSKVEESHEFLEAKQHQEVVKVPVVTAFKTAPALVWLGVGASILGIAAAFFNNTFLLSWTTTELGMPRQQILNALFIIAIVQFIWQPIAAVIAGRIGRTRVMILAILVNLVAVIPLFLAILSGNIVFLVLMLCVTTIGGAGYYAMLASFLADAFPANIRFTGVALANGLCASIIGGSTPLIAQSVLNGFGPWGVAGFYAVLVIATLLAVWGMSRRTGAAVTEAPIRQHA